MFPRFRSLTLHVCDRMILTDHPALLTQSFTLPLLMFFAGLISSCLTPRWMISACSGIAFSLHPAMARWGSGLKWSDYTI